MPLTEVQERRLAHWCAARGICATCPMCGSSNWSTGEIVTPPGGGAAGFFDEEAAALVESSLSALHFLRKGNVGPGKTVLIVGASGAVGTAAVQLAEHFGAQVTGVCSTRNLDLVRSLGADHVIDYTQEDFTESEQRYDVIFDTVIKTSFPRCRDSLVEGGVYLTDDWPLFWALWTSMIGDKKVIFGVAPKRTEDLVFLRDLVEEGKLRPVVDRSYPLEQIVEAHRHVETGHKKGAVVIAVHHAE